MSRSLHKIHESSKARAYHEYSESYQATRTLLAEIDAALGEFDDKAAMGGVDFGHAGAMAHYREQLQNIADSLLRRGEYAKLAR